MTSCGRGATTGGAGAGPMGPGGRPPPDGPDGPDLTTTSSLLPAARGMLTLRDAGGGRGGMRFQGKTVIVTGGAQGIGRACARRSPPRAAAVMIADIAVEAGEALAAEICAGGGKARSCAPTSATRARPAPGRRHARMGLRRRRAGQQCRHHQDRRLPRAERGRFRRRAAGQPEGRRSWSARRRRGRWRRAAAAPSSTCPRPTPCSRSRTRSPTSPARAASTS